MNGLVIAKRSGIGTAPDGTKHRIVRGKTVADPRHPIVVAYPGDWFPMEVHLPAPDDDEAVAGAPEDEGSLRHQVEKLTNHNTHLTKAYQKADAEAAEYRAQLEAVVEVLAEHGFEPPAELTPGWLARLVDQAVDREPAPVADETPEPKIVIDASEADPEFVKIFAAGGVVKGNVPAVGEGPQEEAFVTATAPVPPAPPKPRKRAPRAAS